MSTVFWEKIPFILIILLVGGVYFLVRHLEHDLAEELSKYDFSLAPLLPVALYIVDKLPFKLTTAYDRQIRGQLADLYGHRYLQTYVVVHNAQRVTYIVACLLAFSFLALVGAVDVWFIILFLCAIVFSVVMCFQSLYMSLKLR